MLIQQKTHLALCASSINVDSHAVWKELDAIFGFIQEVPGYTFITFIICINFCTVIGKTLELIVQVEILFTFRAFEVVIYLRTIWSIGNAFLILTQIKSRLAFRTFSIHICFFTVLGQFLTFMFLI